MRDRGFIQQASESSPFLSESKILSQIASMGKAVIISMDDLLYFQKYYKSIKDLIERAKVSNFLWVTINSDGTYTEEKLKIYKGHSFIVNDGIEFLYSYGKINEELDSCLEKNKKMQERLKMLHPVSELNEVFEHFKINCRHKKEYYEECFSHDKVIKKEVREQELRNILMKYLKNNMRGEVSVEFCTDYLNDEESVDIYLNDGNERAIIEVKFSFERIYYEGKTFYNIFTRIEDGINQLNKYAIHLAKDSRLVDYGYVYMFYIKDMDESQIEKEINDKIVMLKRSFSSELYSIFSGVKTNDMKAWCPQC